MQENKEDMPLENMQKIIEEITVYMANQMKREQQQKVRNYKSLNKSAKEGTDFVYRFFTDGTVPHLRTGSKSAVG